MNERLILLIIFSLFLSLLQAQSLTDSSGKDMSEIVVQAFGYNRKLMDVPAAILAVNQKQLLRFSNTSFLPALNTQPGIRMEERSPGSYRLNIRGSSLRSPFGVRNVKVYLNEIPFTEPGGSTYLNLLSFFNIQSIEVIKGPAGSIYGAGSGGAMLLHSNLEKQPAGVAAEYSTGSFGLQNYNVQARLGKGTSQQTFGFTKMHSEGYRHWTQLNRSVFTWDGKFIINERQVLRTFVLYADLAYQTPGGLTLSEYQANPKRSRPSVGAMPSSEQARAGVHQTSYLTGLTHELSITESIKNTSSVYGAFSQFANPTIRNFERRLEPHTGGRTVFTIRPSVQTGTFKLAAGAELQKGWYNIRNYRNLNGNSDSLQTEDEVIPSLWSVFAQADRSLPGDWSLTAGISLNQTKIEIKRLNRFPLRTQQRTYQNEIAPRIAILKKIRNEISLFISAAKGFSPPTTAEVLPSTGVISVELNAEEGWNYELGARLNLLQEKLFIDLNGFFFRLNNTIVQRRDAGGADFFVNAGSTNQKGLETMIHYQLITKPLSSITQSNVWISYTYHNFRYKNFKQLTTDYSGNRIPAVPRHNLVMGYDVQLKQGLYSHITFNYVSDIALNDANTFFAEDYFLLAIRFGYRHSFKKGNSLDLFASGDNLLNETYSLGNDINAAGNRFFNVAPGRNITAGIRLFFGCKQN